MSYSILSYSCVQNSICAKVLFNGRKLDIYISVPYSYANVFYLEINGVRVGKLYPDEESFKLEDCNNVYNNRVKSLIGNNEDMERLCAYLYFQYKPQKIEVKPFEYKFSDESINKIRLNIKRYFEENEWIVKSENEGFKLRNTNRIEIGATNCNLISMLEKLDYYNNRYFGVETTFLDSDIYFKKSLTNSEIVIKIYKFILDEAYKLDFFTQFCKENNYKNFDYFKERLLSKEEKEQQWEEGQRACFARQDRERAEFKKKCEEEEKRIRESVRLRKYRIEEWVEEQYRDSKRRKK